MPLYDRIRELPLEIEDVELDITERGLRREFTRRTTTVKMRHGVQPARRERRRNGRGRHLRPERAPAAPSAVARSSPARGRSSRSRSSSTRRSCSRRAIRSRPPTATTAAGRSSRRRSTWRSSRRGARSPTSSGASRRPIRFVSSTRAASLDDWLELYPTLRFKLDPTPDWTDEFTRALADRGDVDVVDLKGAYHGTVGRQPPDPELYRRVAEAFPEAWIEDPALDAGDRRRARAAPRPHHLGRADPLLGGRRGAAVHAALPQLASRRASGRSSGCSSSTTAAPSTGSRSTAAASSSSASAAARSRLLAALFHPDGPNDVAPGGYNSPEPEPGLPVSPLTPNVEPGGFRRAVL